MVDLDDTVEEVEKQIRNADDPDYEELLNKERSGKDRKTIKEFLQKKIEKEEEEMEEEVEEEIVEEIEEETEGGVFSNFTDPQILVGGAVMGLVLGLVLGAVYMPTDAQNQITETQAEEKVLSLIGASGQVSQEDVEVTVDSRNNMYYVNATATQTVNGTETQQSQTYYMTTDGKMMFPEVVSSPLGNQPVAINVDDALRRTQQQTRPEQPQQGGNTSQ